MILKKQTTSILVIENSKGRYQQQSDSASDSVARIDFAFKDIADNAGGKLTLKSVNHRIFKAGGDYSSDFATHRSARVVFAAYTTASGGKN